MEDPGVGGMSDEKGSSSQGPGPGAPTPRYLTQTTSAIRPQFYNSVSDESAIWRVI